MNTLEEFVDGCIEIEGADSSLTRRLDVLERIVELLRLREAPSARRPM
jgi:hypothetical protein